MANQRSGKRTPAERWKTYVEEGYRAFLASKQFRVLRREGLKVLGRTRLYTPEEWNVAGGTRSRANNLGYRAFVGRCDTVGAQFGIAGSEIVLACLFKRAKPAPNLEPTPLPTKSPTVLVVTDNEDDLFLQWLLYEASNIGLRVAVNRAGTTAPVIAVPFPQEPDVALAPDRRPPEATAFFVRLDLPPYFPPEGAAALARQAQQLGRELLRRLGYPTPQRLRSRPLVADSKKLRLAEDLGRRGLGDIVEDTIGVEAAKDPKARARVSKTRYRGKQQLLNRTGTGEHA